MSKDESLKNFTESIEDALTEQNDDEQLIKTGGRFQLAEAVTLGTHHYFHLVTSNKVMDDSKIKINENMFLEPRTVEFENGKIQKILTAYVNYNCFTELNFEKFDSPNVMKNSLPLPKQLTQNLELLSETNQSKIQNSKERQKYLKSELKNIIKKEIITIPLNKFVEYFDNYNKYLSNLSLNSFTKSVIDHKF